MAIARLVKKTLKHVGSIKVGAAAGIEAFLDQASKEFLDVTLYSTMLEGLIVQDTGEENVYLIPAGSKIRISPDERLYCRWHNGPLDRRDNVLERRYCSVTADTKQGYCIKHARTYRALYERCVSTSGDYSLEACRRVEEKMSIPMGVYIVDRGLEKFKTGVSRSWRLEDRVSEQPHIVAAIIVRGIGLLEARETEIKLAQNPYIQQLTKRVNPVELIKTSVDKRAPLLASLVKSLNLKTRPEYLSVHPADVNAWMSSSHLKEPWGVYTLYDSWGGYLLLEADNKYYWTSFRQIQHRNTVEQLS
ncbi:MAG: hypothetical protein LRS47_03100 [Desulfurococcales archaeon]|nr:hypothetical protein [Desulfurococcales archaeon]